MVHPPWHPSRRPLVRSSCSLCASVSLFVGLHHCRSWSWRSKKELESENWLAETKPILWMCDGLENLICWRLMRSNHCDVSKMTIWNLYVDVITQIKLTYFFSRWDNSILSRCIRTNVVITCHMFSSAKEGLICIIQSVTISLLFLHLLV